MEPRNENQYVSEIRSNAKKPRFKVEKLEERIAPAKGGIPGPPGGYTCHGNGRWRDRICGS